MQSSNAVPHSYLTFTCAHCSQSFQAPVSCGNRFCPVCSGPRRRRVLSKMRSCFDLVHLADGEHFRHLVLTVPSDSNARSMADHLVKSFRRLRQRRIWKKKVTGGCFVVEATGGGNSWHIHIHCIIQSRWMSYNKLLKAWKAVSGGSGVYIKTLKPHIAANYLTKYITKDSVSLTDQFALSGALKGMRLFSVFGTWHALSLSVPKVKYCCPYCLYSCFYFDSGAKSGHDEIRRQQARVRDPVPGSAGTSGDGACTCD